MKKKEELQHLNKEWKNMKVYFQGFLNTGDQEDLHKMRVQIKKLKAMLTLLESTTGHHGLMKQFKPVKKLFKRAGEIRDAHVNLQLSSQYDFQNERFEQGQLQIIERGAHELQQQGSEILKDIKHAHKMIKKEIPRVHNKSLAEFYKKQLEQIAVNFTVSGFTEDMHTNRKLIKVLIYNYKLTGEALNGILQFNTNYLDKLQEAIGKWHDNVVATALFLSPELNDKGIATRIKKMNAGVKRTITSLADDFFNKATSIEQTIEPA